MKKNKLLFIAPCLTVVSLAPVIVACGGQDEQAKIIDAIFGPLDKQAETISSFSDKLKSMSQEERNNELLYDLFAIGLETHTMSGEASPIKTMKQLYDDGIIGIQTNISKKSLSFNDEGELHATFLGYVSFVFVKDYEESKANDYMMLTFDMLNLNVQIDEPSCSLMYDDNIDVNNINIKNEDPEFCIGFIKLRSNGGQEEHMVYIKDINVKDATLDIPKNSKNWVKAN